MASLAVTMGVFPHVSMRVPAIQPIQQRRRTTISCCSAVKQRSESACVSGHHHHHHHHNQWNGSHAVTVASSMQTQRDDNVLTGSTRTVTTLLGMTLLCMKAFANKMIVPLPSGSVSVSAGPLFFAAVRGLNTPMTVVAAGLRKWLDIYSGVLLVRVLLSWFPNIPWERQPLSAIRDLCDPYLSLFRNVIPPVFDTLDVSPLLAFAVLGSLSSILKGTT